MRILGIDPGPRFTAYVLFDTDKNEILAWNETTKIGDKTFYGVDNNIALAMIYQLHETIGVDEVAIEMIESYGMSVGKEVFMTCVWIGRFYESAKADRDRVLLVPRKMVKINLCNSHKAKDPNIRQALIDRFGLPGTKKNPGLMYPLHGDMYAAFAVAVTAWDEIGNIKNYLENL